MPTTIVAATCPLPPCNLAPRDVEGLVADLAAYAQQFQPAFARMDQAAWAYRYLQGLVSDHPRKSIEPMALAHGFPIRSMQAFIGDSPWPTAPLIVRHQQHVAQTLGEDDAVILVDESGFPKQGDHSVGVAPQYCGALGKVANCQVGVYLGYVSRHGYTLLTGQLFVPAGWFADDHTALRATVGIPATLTFQTKPELALSLLQDLMQRKAVPARWLAADALYGDSPAFRDGVAALGLWYFTEIAGTTLIWRRHPALIIPPWSGRGRKPTKQRLKTPSNRPYQVNELLRRLPKTAWVRGIVKEGAKGPIVCDFAFVRVTECRQGLPGPRLWLVLRRNVADPTEVKCYLSNAPEPIDALTLVRMSGMRWPVELSFAEGKTELGMDQYETRSWLGWHHHMLLVMLAHHFLVWVRVHWREQAPALTLGQVRLLLLSVISTPLLTAERALLRVRYVQRRNHAAYCAHRKRKLTQFATFDSAL